MEKARAKGFQEYMQKQRLTDPGSIFLDHAAKQPLIDLLDTIEGGFNLVDMTENYCDKDTLTLALGSLEATLSKIIDAVKESGILSAVLLDPTHPRFDSVRAAIRTAFSVDCETEPQPVDDQSGPRIVK
jgi:hypothetical protein